MASLKDLIVSGESRFLSDALAGTIYADHFVMNGSDGSHVLLGDGSHKALSDFSLDGHNHDSRYLKLSGGTMTGPIEISTGSLNNNYNEGLRITKANNGWAGITFGSTGLSGAPTNGWFAALNPSGQFIISPDSSANTTGLTLNKNGNALWRNNIMLHAGNYTDYTVTKTGTGASGTWGINVTGSAGSVAWGNITGKPDSFAPSTHTHDNYALKYNTYGIDGALANCTNESNDIARGDLGAVGFCNDSLNLQIFEAASGADYPSTANLTITNSTTTIGSTNIGAQIPNGTNANQLYKTAAGSKLKLIITGASYLKAVALWLSSEGTSMTCSCTPSGASTAVSSTLSTYGSWHILNNMSRVVTSITIELNTTNVNKTITLKGIRNYVTNPANLRFPGKANAANTADSATSATNATNADKTKTVTSTSANNHYLTLVDSDNSSATAESIYTTPKLYAKPSTGDLYSSGKVFVNNSTTCLGADSASVLWLANSAGYPLVASSNVVRRGASMDNGQLGDNTYPWAATYTKKVRSNSTLYLGSASSTSILFTINDSEVARFCQPYGYLGIGATAPTQKLHVAGNAKFEGGFGSKGTQGTVEGAFIAHPGGGCYATGDSTKTGYLKITLPQKGKNTMMSFDITIYTYTGDNHSYVTYHISGYEYSTNGWHDPVTKVYSEGIGAYANLKVRLGNDGTKACVTIGESNTSWSYPQVTIHNIMTGYSNSDIDTWIKDWKIEFTTTALTTIVSTKENVNTQNINILGNAATATSATSATSATDSDKVDGLHMTINGSLPYKYNHSVTFETASMTSDYWYVTLSFTGRSYIQYLTKSILSADYSNRQAQIFLNTYTYYGSWYAFSTYYEGSNIEAIALKSQNKPIYYIKLKKPTNYNGSVPDGSFSVLSTYDFTLTASADPPTGVTFVTINSPGFTNLEANSLSTTPSLQAGTSDTKKITVTAGGKTSAEFTVPFATSATTATNLTNSPVLAVGRRDTNAITVTVGGQISEEFNVPFAKVAAKLSDNPELAVGENRNTITVTAGGLTSRAFTVPYATAAGSAHKLSTVSKTAWGQTFWTSGGIPATISGNMSSVGNIAFSASGKNIGGFMYFDTTNSRIGIGISAPTTALDVSGDIQATGDARIKGNDLYIGSASGSQCHQTYDPIKKCIRFSFD